ncbi:hypothetical protein AVEN_106421-1 [Araneus ventricosus]|uniref:Uncharacterized protein n=1 Tax=Araneus ventricosus TaxID=182803 RepID=A0A4Y2ASF3_ARAVE|nr:hypothetical protein AVEN_106421-1 [Araneus ventricosus]
MQSFVYSIFTQKNQPAGVARDVALAVAKGLRPSSLRTQDNAESFLGTRTQLPETTEWNPNDSWHRPPSMIVGKQLCRAVSIAASVALTVPSISSAEEGSSAERARGSGATHRVYLRSEAAGQEKERRCGAPRTPLAANLIPRRKPSSLSITNTLTPR